MANLAQTLKSGLASPVAKVSILSFSYHLLLAAICALILEQFYIKYGASLSNRQKLARNFLLITVTTTPSTVSFLAVGLFLKHVKDVFEAFLL